MSVALAFMSRIAKNIQHYQLFLTKIYSSVYLNDRKALSGVTQMLGSDVTERSRVWNGNDVFPVSLPEVALG